MSIVLDGTNGITTPAVDTDGLSVDTNTLFVDAANNRVGVGTSAPNATLDVRGFATFGPIDTALQFQGVSMVNGRDSAAINTVSFLDTRNNLEVVDTHIFMEHQTNGGSNIQFGTTPAGSRSSDRRVERMRIDSEGRVFRPQQPHCLVSQNGGTRTIGVAPFGVANGGFISQNGGFFLGGLINGFNVVHVPVTGFYRIDHLVYVLSNIDSAGARLYVFRNDSEEIVFTQNLVNGDGTNFASKEVFLNANDYINYRGYGRDYSYFFANNHTMLGIHFIG